MDKSVEIGVPATFAFPESPPSNPPGFRASETDATEMSHRFRYNDLREKYCPVVQIGSARFPGLSDFNFLHGPIMCDTTLFSRYRPAFTTQTIKISYYRSGKRHKIFMLHKKRLLACEGEKS